MLRQRYRYFVWSLRWGETKMSDKLKTANELAEPLEFVAKYGPAEMKIIQYGKLRKEAIKWVKKLDGETEIDLRFCVIWGIKPFQKDILDRDLKIQKVWVIRWIKHFFNLNDGVKAK